MNPNDKRPLFSKPTGCFVQLIGAGILFSGIYQVTKSPPEILWGIVLLAGGVAILLLGRKTK